MVNIALIDNHDSFTGNLYQLFDENKSCRIKVIPYSQININELEVFDKLVFSPGPDIPKRYPLLSEILNRYSTTKSILGICLGHQTIVEHFGGSLYNLPKVKHGVKEKVYIENNELLFADLPNAIDVGLYHSWAANPRKLPKDFTVIAKNKEGIIMGISHNLFNIIGLQFHPESYMTDFGKVIINNWLHLK
ncbi:gamma-glutamyl-gamma-aminobutyrate hydrolase family protein [Apibacter raozihei]|uniref:anthranilate synthase component II n=1 Tax=Apibacter raozihei TaxID=2500547 RepID=UPI000FE41F62|nr:gamma-glutamyl-gamma-aminobutyrate hydrolase family protein [Apibacter raozihei]